MKWKHYPVTLDISKNQWRSTGGMSGYELGSDIFAMALCNDRYMYFIILEYNNMWIFFIIINFSKNFVHYYNYNKSKFLRILKKVYTIWRQVMRQEKTKTKFTWPQVLKFQTHVVILAPAQLSIFPRISFMTLPAAPTDILHL